MMESWGTGRIGTPPPSLSVPSTGINNIGGGGGSAISMTNAYVIQLSTIQRLVYLRVPLTCGSPTMMESWGPGRIGTPPPSLPVPPAGTNNGSGGVGVGGVGATSMTSANVVKPSTTAPIASPEGVSDVSQKSGIWEGPNSSNGGGGGGGGGGGTATEGGPSRSVSHAASLDAISRKAIKPDTTRPPCRSLTCSVSAKHSKIFPGVASESDLQKWRTSKDRKSPSLSQMGPDSIKHKDNGSAKYFQGAMHTPNMGEKVAQVYQTEVCQIVVLKCLVVNGVNVRTFDRLFVLFVERNRNMV
ncbi:hypothetical protein M0804_007136 [Polistes exclamans]|nr:hypothetical protein M0804_007136 [Polistes exclamans]